MIIKMGYTVKEDSAFYYIAVLINYSCQSKKISETS